MLDEKSQMQGQMGMRAGESATADARVCIAVDVMGADTDPVELLKGVDAALAEDPNLEVLLAGPEALLSRYSNNERIKLAYAEDVIRMDEHPAQAVRNKPQASICVAARAVHEGQADGLFSCGSTGAVLTASALGIGRIKGIKRPALGLAFPGKDDHKTVILDLGANADVRPEMMVQFAYMGRAYSKLVVGCVNPRVGLLSNGREDEKGSELSHSYFEALVDHGEQLNFIGNAEGSDVLDHGFDVIVADGFTGNVALKSVESAAKFLMRRIKSALDTSFKAKVGALLLKTVIKAAGAELSGDDYGGAIFLGLKNPVIKGHGSTSAYGVKNGILSCAAAVRSHLVEEIQASIAANR